MKTQVMDRIGEAASKVTVGAGAASALWGWLTVERLFSLFGVFVTVVGLLVSWHYKRKADARHAVETALQRRKAKIEAREAALREELLRARIEHLRASAPAAVLQTDSDYGCLEGEK